MDSEVYPRRSVRAPLEEADLVAHEEDDSQRALREEDELLQRIRSLKAAGSGSRKHVSNDRYLRGEDSLDDEQDHRHSHGDVRWKEDDKDDEYEGVQEQQFIQGRSEGIRFYEHPSTLSDTNLPQSSRPLTDSWEVPGTMPAQNDSFAAARPSSPRLARLAPVSGERSRQPLDDYLVQESSRFWELPARSRHHRLGSEEDIGEEGNGKEYLSEEEERVMVSNGRDFDRDGDEINDRDLYDRRDNQDEHGERTSLATGHLDNFHIERRSDLGSDRMSVNRIRSSPLVVNPQSPVFQPQVSPTFKDDDDGDDREVQTPLSPGEYFAARTARFPTESASARDITITCTAGDSVTHAVQLHNRSRYAGIVTFAIVRETRSVEDRSTLTVSPERIEAAPNECITAELLFNAGKVPVAAVGYTLVVTDLVTRRKQCFRVIIRCIESPRRSLPVSNDAPLLKADLVALDFGRTVDVVAGASLHFRLKNVHSRAELSIFLALENCNRKGCFDIRGKRGGPDVLLPGQEATAILTLLPSPTESAAFEYKCVVAITARAADGSVQRVYYLPATGRAANGA